MSLFKTFVKIPENKMDNEAACTAIDKATHEAELVFGEHGYAVTTMEEIPVGATYLKMPFIVKRPPNGKVLAIRFYPGCYLVARKVETTTAGVVVHLESYYSKSAGKDIAVPKAIPKGSVLLIAELSEFQLDLIDEPIVQLWDYFQYTIICTTARYRRAYFDRADDILAESYMYFMRAVRRVQQGLAARENVPAFIASYLREATHNLLYTDWFIKPVRSRSKETGKEHLTGVLRVNSLDFKETDVNPGSDDEKEDFANVVAYDSAVEIPPIHETIIYNFKQISTDPSDITILEMLYSHHTYEEIGKELGGISRAAVQQRVAKIKRDYTYLITNIPIDISPSQERIIVRVERTPDTATIFAINSLAWDAIRPHIAMLLGATLPVLTDKEKREQVRLDPRLPIPLPVADRFFTAEERAQFGNNVAVKTFTYSEILKQLS